MSDILRCPTCVAQGERSTVTAGLSVVTAMAAHDYYDEDGQHHYHDPNVRSRSFACSQGHHWQDQRKPSCPVCGKEGW